jgi:hypothetical protein
LKAPKLTNEDQIKSSFSRKSQEIKRKRNQIIKTDFNKQKKKIKAEMTDITKWGYDLEISHSENINKSRKIRLKKNYQTEKFNKEESLNMQQQPCSYHEQNKIKVLTLPKDNYDSERENNHYPVEYRHLRDQGRRYRKDYDTREVSSNGSNFDMKNDFFSKVEMMSRQSAPQNRNSLFSEADGKQPYSSANHTTPNDKHDDVNILISFGEAFINKEPNDEYLKRENDFSKKQLNFKIKTNKLKYKANQKKSYYTQTCNRWGWSNSYSSKSERMHYLEQIGNKSQDSKSKIMKKKSNYSLKEEQQRLRKTLKSIKF